MALKTTKTFAALATVGIIALLVIAWNPSNTSFNTNQFDATAPNIQIKSGVQLTNTVLNGSTVGHGGGLTNIPITGSGAALITTNTSGVVNILSSNAVVAAGTITTVSTNAVTGGSVYTVSSPNPTNNDVVVSNAVISYIQPTYYPTNAYFSTFQWISSVVALPVAANLAAMSGGASTNNVHMIYIRDSFWITNTTWFVGTTSSGEHWGIGLYDLAGNRLWSDVVLTTSANAVTHTATNYKVVPGWYYLDVVTDSTSARVFGWTIGSSELQVLNSSSGPLKYSFQCPPVTVSGQPPATLTLGSAATRFAEPPMGEIPQVIFQ